MLYACIEAKLARPVKLLNCCFTKRYSFKKIKKDKNLFYICYTLNDNQILLLKIVHKLKMLSTVKKKDKHINVRLYD